ncbi:DivIVA domain-containing protein [Heliobacterium chlorum]|uniref:DivIVA domain-containing protein n=1 Tax=Heliobacterium chlorum TaxID=2698 RepID=A0ABR7SZK5_HELCL|nr:DivIVA domain-containing protein [Heliobacterium chlorum]MBC9783292.1 DivIVA domain-containing protein [Heliobacterium chlorum]
MLTPLEIHQKQFRKGAWGYKPEEVEDFLRQVSQAHEELYKENILLKEQVAHTEENLLRYRHLEETLNNTLVLAQRTAEEVRLSAEREAELRVKEARMQAEKILESARAKKSEIEREYEHMRNQARQFRVQFRAMLTSQLEAFKEEARDEAAVTLEATIPPGKIPFLNQDVRLPGGHKPYSVEDVQVPSHFHEDSDD